MNYMQSNQVRVFPSTRRSTSQLSARYQQESTYVDIIRRICDYKSYNGSNVEKSEGSFIYTQPLEKVELGSASYLYYNENEPFEFFIYGYWFRLSSLTELFSLINLQENEATDIYAYIDLDKYQIGANETEDNKKEYRIELMGRDDPSGKYLGLKFTTSLPAESSTLKLIHLFHRNNTTEEWKNSVVINCLFKFDINMMDLAIDGGVII